ncbi:cytochrome P450 [Abortiporus biennis]|nr:cytochrome P450 [Abortiporus biennis]
MFDIFTVFSAAFVTLIVLTIYELYKWRLQSFSLPPGPKGLPFIGNVLDMPSGEERWKAVDEMSKKYGNIMYLYFPNQPTIIVDSAQVAIDLLEKRSQIYSDRARGIVEKYIGWEWNLGSLPYGSVWRATRRCFHQYFNQNAVLSHQDIQIKETRTFLRRVLEHPEDCAQLSRLMFSASILRIVYGIKINDLSDEYFEMAEIAMHGFSLGRSPGLFMVEYLPFLQYLPSWFPGATFKKVAKHISPYVLAMRNEAFDKVKDAMISGNVEPCLTQTLITKIRTEQDEDVARNVTGVAFGASSDTSASASYAFLITMAQYPDIQQRAQAEIDAHLSPDKLLSRLEDVREIPYLRALLMEILRFRVIVPFGVPHRLIQEDFYNGYVLPKGTIVVPNIWSMLNNPEDYPEQEVFNPDRFLKDGAINPSVRDPTTIAFGFGRRICPGRPLAINSLLLQFASILQVFNVLAATDENGCPMNLNVRMSSGLVSMPEQVPCVLLPRSDAARELVEKWINEE